MSTAPPDSNYHPEWRGAPLTEDGDGSIISAVLLIALTVGVVVLVMPPMTRAFDQRRINGALETLTKLRRGLTSSNGFVRVVGTSPLTLSELTQPVWNSRGGPAPVPRNSCGGEFTNAQVARWDKAGPFLSFAIDGTGLDTPIGLVSDTLRPVGNARIARELAIVVHGVSKADASAMDRDVDGSDGRMRGVIRWSDGAGERALFYTLPVRHVC